MRWTRMLRLRGRCSNKDGWDGANEFAAQTLDSIFTMMVTIMIDEVLAFKMLVISSLIFESMMCHTMYELQLIKVRSVKDYTM